MSRVRHTLAAVFWCAMPLIAFTAFAASSTQHDDGNLLAAHFARGFTFTPATDAPIQTLLIPLDVYRTVARTDLGDVRVFNASGAVVPHAIRTRDTSTTLPPPAEVALPYFPLRGVPERGVEAVEIRVQQDQATGTVTVARTDVTSTDTAVVGYLIHLGDVPLKVHHLDLGVQPTGEGFVARVVLETSHDLASWRVAATGSVALLEYQGQRLERRSIDLPAGDSYHGYFRLSWGQTPRPFELTALSAVLEAAAPEPERQRLMVDLTPDAKIANRYLFDLGGAIPIDRVAVTLPELNTLVHARLLSSATPSDPWSGRFDGRLYRVSWKGEELASPPIDLTVSRDRHWRLEVDPTGGGMGQGAPRVEVLWRPEQLLFVARGSAPFTVAYGNIAVGRSPLDAANLVAVVPGLRLTDLPEQTGSTGEPKELSGAAALVAPRPPFPWQRVILWTVLLFGVGVLAMMTWRLYKQLS